MTFLDALVQHAIHVASLSASTERDTGVATCHEKFVVAELRDEHAPVGEITLRRLEGRESIEEPANGEVQEGDRGPRARRGEPSVAALRQLCNEARATVAAIEKILDEDEAL